MKSLFLLFLSIFGLVGAIKAQNIHTCTIMPVAGAPVASSSIKLPHGAMGAVSYKPQMNSYWRQGSTLKVKFMGGSNRLRSKVMQHANTWAKYANINFETTSSSRADIRVAFVQNGASWSVVGKQSSYLSQNEPTMNFGWLTDATPDYEVRRTVLHEFGHALGLLHEHQNPVGGIPWDKEAVYSYYKRTQGWDRKTTYDNVIATLNKNISQYSAYDEESIMHYPISPYLTGGRYEVGMNQTLSPTDKAYIAMLYPGRNVVAETSEPKVKPPTTTTTIPSKVKTKPNRPTHQHYSVKVNNSLGKNQKSEVVHLYISGKKYVLGLSKGKVNQKTINLNLHKGQHNYKVVTSSVYFGYRKVWNGRKVVKKYVEKTIEGKGAGKINVDGNEQLVLYGSYDKNSGTMKVYLGDANKQKRELVHN